MTQTLIEKLEALRRFSLCRFGTSSAMIEHPQGSYVNIEDLRAIIEQYKTEGACVTGWKLVPENPTVDMLTAAETPVIYSVFDIYRPIYKAMLAAAPPAPDIVAELVKAFLHEDDLAWLIRFKETAEDDNRYDTPKGALKRLIEIGVVRRIGFGRCTTTSFGDWILETYFEQSPNLPLAARPTDLGD